jgi:hypothetical protein
MDVQTSYLWYAKCFVDSVIKKIGDENEETRSKIIAEVQAKCTPGLGGGGLTTAQAATITNIYDTLSVTSGTPFDPLDPNSTVLDFIKNINTTCTGGGGGGATDVSKIENALDIANTKTISARVDEIQQGLIQIDAKLGPVVQRNVVKTILSKTITALDSRVTESLDPTLTSAEKDIRVTKLVDNIKAVLTNINTHMTNPATALTKETLSTNAYDVTTGGDLPGIENTYYPSSSGYYDDDQAYYPYERQSRSWFW